MRAQVNALTPAERALAAHLVERGLVPGLQSVHALAAEAGQSAATVTRLARKLGYGGFADLQAAIRAELAARVRPPLEKLPAAGVGDHPVGRFAATAAENLARTAERLDLAAFDAAADLLADPEMRVHVLGGRITGAVAQGFGAHLQLIRAGVALMDRTPAGWAQALLDIDARAALVLFDIRRYEEPLERLAALVAGQGGRVVLMTDQWGSPIERHAVHTFRAHVEAPSAWDSTLALGLLSETLVAMVQDRMSDAGADRIRALEERLGQTRVFRAPRP